MYDATWRCTYHSALKTMIGGVLAIGSDLILNIPLVGAEFELFCEQRQQLNDQWLIAPNTKHFSYDYQVGNEVLKFVYTRPSKLNPGATGPFVLMNRFIQQLDPTAVIDCILLRCMSSHHHICDSKGFLLLLCTDSPTRSFADNLRQNEVSSRWWFQAEVIRRWWATT